VHTPRKNCGICLADQVVKPSFRVNAYRWRADAATTDARHRPVLPGSMITATGSYIVEYSLSSTEHVLCRSDLAKGA